MGKVKIMLSGDIDKGIHLLCKFDLKGYNAQMSTEAHGRERKLKYGLPPTFLRRVTKAVLVQFTGSTAILEED